MLVTIIGCWLKVLVSVLRISDTRLQVTRQMSTARRTVYGEVLRLVVTVPKVGNTVLTVKGLNTLSTVSSVVSCIGRIGWLS